MSICINNNSRKGVTAIGRLLVIEFDELHSSVFDEVMEVLKRYPDFEHLRLSNETKLSLPGLEIYPDRRKAYRDRSEINLTTKEYDLLCLLVANKGRVMTYEQIYQKIWGEEYIGGENNAVGCHIRNLREKLYAAAPDTPFTIKCVREIGYCLEFE